VQLEVCGRAKQLYKFDHLSLKLGVQNTPEPMPLDERLAAHPQLRRQIEQMLDEVENRGGGLNLADDAEDVLVERMRALTRQALTDWAERRQQRARPVPEPGLVRDGKKNSAG
jgi:hypothetical protein